MMKFDTKHTAFHLVVAVYFIWFAVYGVLLYMAIDNVYTAGNPAISKVMMKWILANLIMGTVLFLVIRLFRNATVLARVIFYTYVFMAAATVTTVMIISGT